jgi:hypothetical protein
MIYYFALTRSHCTFPSTVERRIARFKVNAPTWHMAGATKSLTSVVGALNCVFASRSADIGTMTCVVALFCKIGLNRG